MISATDALKYEVGGSWWAGYISTRWMQTVAAKYFGFKTRLKHARYSQGEFAESDVHLEIADHLVQANLIHRQERPRAASIIKVHLK